jgi:hypothetical protein
MRVCVVNALVYARAVKESIQRINLSVRYSEKNAKVSERSQHTQTVPARADNRFYTL